MKTAEELRKEIEVKRQKLEASLDKEYGEKLAQAEARAKVEKAKKTAKARKMVDHAKFVLAGFILAECRRKKNTKIIEEAIAGTKKDTDKKSLQNLLKYVAEGQQSLFDEE